MSDETTTETTDEQLEPEAAPPPVRTAEEWGEAKGLLPQFSPAPARVGQHEAGGRKPNPRFWMFAAARALRAWPVGAEMTEAAFDAAVAEAIAVTSR